MSTDKTGPEQPKGMTGIWPLGASTITPEQLDTFRNAHKGVLINDPAAVFPLPIGLKLPDGFLQPKEVSPIARAMEKTNELLAAGITPKFTIDGEPVDLDAPLSVLRPPRPAKPITVLDSDAPQCAELPTGNDYAVGYAEPWSDPAHDVAADFHALAGPPAPRVPRAEWELPEHPVYELARRVFMIDNSNAPDPAKEWDNAPAAYRDYAFSIAKGLLDAGFDQWTREKVIAIDRVAAAWTDPGIMPEVHRNAQNDLLKRWPVLGAALALLAERFPNARA